MEGIGPLVGLKNEGALRRAAEDLESAGDLSAPSRAHSKESSLLLVGYIGHPT